MAVNKFRGIVVAGFVSTCVVLGGALPSCTSESEREVPSTGADASAPAAKLADLGPGSAKFERKLNQVATRAETMVFTEQPFIESGRYPHDEPLVSDRRIQKMLDWERAHKNDHKVEERPQPTSEGPSPLLAANFNALDDNGTSIPPDTNGAPGPNHLFILLNTQIRIQDKTGTTLSTSTMNTFFGALSQPGGSFDPHVVFDPYAQKWIVVAVANAQSATAAVLLGVSKTTDPTGAWNLYSVPADSTGANWGDYPQLGFNKDWITVTTNVFSNAASPGFIGVRTFVFDKAKAIAGPAGGGGAHTTFTSPSDDFTIAPATTYDATLDRLFMVESYDGTSSNLRLFSITGAVGAESVNSLPDAILPQAPWNFGGLGNFTPQSGTATKLDTGDDRIRNVTYRNSSLWAAHEVFLPAATPTRASVQWFQIRPTDSTVTQSGRIDDPNGVNFFQRGSLAVNKYNDVFLGYSKSSATTFAGSQYSFRYGWDAMNTMRDDTQYKAGLGCYFKQFSGTRNRWGDYSKTLVDPTDDLTMWTIQEYAATPSGACATANTGKWGTWWAKVTIDCTGKAAGEPCDDGSLCTTGPKACNAAGACIASGGPVVCGAPDQCHNQATCDPLTGQCAGTTKANGTACTDGTLCTQNDACTNGVCTPATTTTCTALDACHDVGVCAPGTGICSNPVKATGAACTPTTGDLCFSSFTCSAAGACTGATPKVCTALDQCHDVGTCTPATGACSNPAKANGTTCADNNLCTTNKVCTNGTCGGTAVACTAQDSCHDVGTCNSGTGTCSNPAKADGTTCTPSGTPNKCMTYACAAGACSGGTPKVCTAQDECHTAGTCDTASGSCSNPAKADGTACTNGTCQTGSCTPATVADAGVDSGTVKRDSGTTPVDSGSASDASDAGGPAPANDSGCGCRTAQPRTSNSSLALAGLGGLALIGGLRLRRRARK